MARTPGARNHDFEDKRRALLNTLTDFALDADLRRPSLRQFAIAASTSEPTLRHYFTNRRGLILAILELLGERGRPLWEDLSRPAPNPTEALQEFFRVSLADMREGQFVRAHAFGLIEGMADPRAGQAYLNFLFEPALDSVCLKLHETPGSPTEPGELRAAGLAVLSPLLVLCLHQDVLGGEEHAPIDSAQIISYLEEWLGTSLAS